jgi:hypothetical protein
MMEVLGAQRTRAAPIWMKEDDRIAMRPRVHAVDSVY